MAYLRDYLWIPESDPVYVYEIVPESESREAVIALTAYGIYRNSGRALPWRISWENFLKGELTGEDTGDGIEIWLNNRRLAGNYRGGGQKCIAGMLIKIKNLWERSQ